MSLIRLFPPTSIGGQQFGRLAAAVTQAGNLVEQQLTAGADAHNSVLSKATLRLLNHDDMAGINRAAHSLSLLGTTGLDGKLAMPHCKGAKTRSQIQALKGRQRL